jgi:hypothetical protein
MTPWSGANGSLFDGAAKQCIRTRVVHYLFLFRRSPRHAGVVRPRLTSKIGVGTTKNAKLCGLKD